jgi:hypothetical protein
LPNLHTDPEIIKRVRWNKPDPSKSQQSASLLLQEHYRLHCMPGDFGMTAGLYQPLRAVATGCGRLLLTILLTTATIAAVLVIALTPRRAASLPLYARQTGQPCATCHTAFLELTPFGRRFKLGGYTLGGGDWTGPPFAVMLQPTFTNTQAAQQGGAAPGFGINNNLVMQQMSLFTGGRITDDMGAFIQGTYDGVGHRFGWDNTDIRFAKSINFDGYTLLWGVTANNNPTFRTCGTRSLPGASHTSVPRWRRRPPPARLSSKYMRNKLPV